MSPIDLEHLCLDYQKGVLRWNRQFNLISRQDAETRISRLVRECLAGAEALPRSLDSLHEDLSKIFYCNELKRYCGECLSRLRYVDIGSGAGLPGLIWHAWLTQALDAIAGAQRPALRTVLCEPRSKRAWFLERMIRELDLEDIEVLEQSWAAGEPVVPQGDASGAPRPLAEAAAESPVEGFAEMPVRASGKAPSREPANRQSPRGRTLWLLTLRALRMTDGEIIGGWRAKSAIQMLPDGDRLVICRLMGPGTTMSRALRRRLGWPEEQITGSLPVQELKTPRKKRSVPSAAPLSARLVAPDLVGGLQLGGTGLHACLVGGVPALTLALSCYQAPGSCRP
jgi:hypothetical protein